MRVRVAAFLLALGVSVGGLVPISGASAAVTEPILRDPTPVAGSGTPILSWERVPDATSYDVQVSTDSFASTRWSVSTVNVNTVPTTALPGGQVQWRVRAKAGSTTSAWSSGVFERPALVGPINLTPASGAIQPPDDFPVFDWDPVPGAESYTLQVSTDSSFSDLARLKEYKTKATTYSPTLLSEPNVYHWRVQATLATGINTPWSAESPSYEVKGLRIPDEAQTPVSPEQFADEGQFTSVTDAVLDWKQIPGAATYDLQISTDRNFSTLDHSATKITGTRYARPATLDNDQYFWRIRPVDARGNTLNWSDPSIGVWKFRRHWPDQPSLRYPAADATVGNPFYYEWAPVEHASKYLLEISTSPTMSSVLSKHKCFTTNTTFTPGTIDQAKPSDPACWPDAGGTYYWRVTAYDENTAASGPRTDNTLGVTEIRRFTYLPDAVTTLTPAQDETITVPTLSWEPLALAEQYRVTITSLATGSATTITTTGTSATPRTKLNPGDYRWMVQAVSRDGRTGAPWIASAQPKFTVEAPAAGTAATPEPTGPTGSFARLPTLTWTPVSQAAKYEVHIRPVGSLAWQVLNSTVHPAMEAYGTASDRTDNLLAPQEYEWRVVAFNSVGVATEGTTTSTVSISAPGEVSGRRAALAAGSFGTDECDASLPSECQDLRATPILRWNASPTASKYLLRVSRDAEWTNVIKSFHVDDTMAMPRFQWADSQAGSAYFWEVFECGPGACVATGHAQHSFNKESHPIEVVSPGDLYTPGTPEAELPQVSDDVTLEWRDYLASNLAATPNGSALTTPPRLGARYYEVQVATDPSFTSIIDSAKVDQTSYTSATTTYPEGTIYWRVRAYDGDANPLTWSATRTFVKRSPVPVLDDTSTDVLTWDALPFAASYDIEVYKEGDTSGSTTNRVVSAAIDQPRYTPTTPWKAGMSYAWRVRRVDAKSRKGGWSEWGQFTATGQAPTLTAPDDAAEVAPREGVFTWQAVDGAKAYRFETWADGVSTKVETATTRSLAFAPTKVLPAGTLHWSVTALDGADQELGTAQRGYSVRGLPSATVPVSIDGVPKVGRELLAVEPEWDMPDVTTTYVWLRDNRAITGATGPTYTAVVDDFDKKLTVRATGLRLGFDVGTSTSEPVTIGAGPRLVANVKPLVTGTPRVGNRLSVSTGTWPVTTQLRYQWVRAGAIIPGAISNSYLVVPADAGNKVWARVTAVSKGYTDTIVNTNKKGIAKLSAKVTVTVTPQPVRSTARATLSGYVSVAGVPSPTGRVEIWLGGKVIKKLSLSTTAGGRFTHLLPRRAVGSHAIVVKYLGNASTKASSRKATLRVIR